LGKQKENFYSFSKEQVSYVKSKPKHVKKVFKAFVFCTIVGILNVIYFAYLESPSSLSLKKQHNRAVQSFSELQIKIDSLNVYLRKIQENDEIIYRPVLEKQSLPLSIREAGFGGTEKNPFSTGVLSYGKAASVVLEAEKLAGKITIQLESLNEIDEELQIKTDFETRVPAILPIHTDDLKRVSSYFGMRKDPFTGKLKRHHGIDYAGKLGSPIYVTGAGTVEKVKYSNKGYGNEVVVNHGYGYKTRYAHLHEILVKKGQVVNRGDILATLGNSGRSTGPHLHYEVLFKRKRQNPLYFYNNDLEREEFEKIVKK
jgi:murein DD-endopeptidase MepM/ murein hydrolase activator NlpD